MKSGVKHLMAALLAVVLALCAYYVIATPLPVAIYYATDSTSPGWHRTLFRLRSRAVLSCPQSSDFGPSTPLIYLLSTMDTESVDVIEAKALFMRYLQNGCGINAISNSGLRPIHVAILYRSPELLKFVIDQGADPEQKTGPDLRYGNRSPNLSAEAYLDELCVKRNTGCDELRAILATAKR